MSQAGLGLISSGSSGSKPPRRGKSALAVLSAVVVLLVIVGGAGFFAYTSFLKPAPDYAGDGTGSVMVVVRPGDGIPAIGESLQAADVVQSARAFVSAASDDPRARGIQPGTYRMRTQMSAKAALAILVDPANRTGVITIPEGSRASRVAEIAAAVTGLPVADFLAVMRSPSGLGLPAYAKGSVEGFLFPSTYDVGEKPNATQVLAAMVAKYKEVAARVQLDQRSAAMRQTPYSILTIASIIQAEGQVEDYPKIARVIYNRLECTLPTCKSEYIQRRLQMDSTINYANGISELHLTQEQLSQDGPYNTYKNPGLPPTPIDNPGEAAIEAALSPAQGNWLYFVSVPGFTKFSENHAQQQEAEKQWHAMEGGN